MLGMQDFQAKQALPKDILACILRVICFEISNDWCHCIFHQLNKDPKAVSKVVLVEYLKNDLVTSKLVHQSDLVAHHHPLLIVLALDELEGTH